MLTPDEVTAMVRLHGLGWGSKRIAAALSCARNTVKRYVAAGGWRAQRRGERQRRLAGLEGWLSDRFRQHRGNCDVVRQDLRREHGITVSLRTLERATASLRQVLRAEAQATLRFETAPGRQLQIDFGEVRVPIAGEAVKLHLFVATVGYSRRPYVRVFRHQRQSAWFDGLEGAFRYFNGVPQEVLLDNPKALEEQHDTQTREVLFNQRLAAFARHWRFRPRAWAPYWARTKGKDERGVGYVKPNAIAGHRFDRWAAREAHLAWWMREIADERVHGTTGERPRECFDRDEAAALQPLNGRPPFGEVRDLVRRVQGDCAVEVDTNSYSVPWRLVGETVQVTVAEGRVQVSHAGQEIAVHAVTAGRRQRIADAAHFHGVAGTARPATVVPYATPSLLRPLGEYERIAGGGW
jgi:transposase